MTRAGIPDPDLEHQTLTAPWALRELDRIRHVTLHTEDHTMGLVTRRGPLQNHILGTLKVDTSRWNKTHIT